MEIKYHKTLRCLEVVVEVGSLSGLASGQSSNSRRTHEGFVISLTKDSDRTGYTHARPMSPAGRILLTKVGVSNVNNIQGIHK